MEFKLTGMIRELESLRPAPGLLVRAYDKDIIYDDLLGNAITDEEGFFQIGYERKDFHEIFEGPPEIYLVVYGSATAQDPGRADDSPIYTTEETPVTSQDSDQYFEINVSREQLGDDSPSGPIVSTPEPGEWKEKIQEYIRTHPIGFTFDPEKGFSRPILEFVQVQDVSWVASVAGPLPEIGESKKLPLRLTNKGNGVSVNAYVELWETPIVYYLPWVNSRLCDYRVLTISPGEIINLELLYTRQIARGNITGVCYDPFLDPRPLWPLGVPSRQTTGIGFGIT